jgi:hypothetical protein
LIESLHGHALREVGDAPEHALAHEEVAGGRGGLRQGHQVDRVDDVDAEAQEAALAPVDDLVSEPELDRHVAEVEVRSEVGVLEIRTAADGPTAVAAQVRAPPATPLVLEIVEAVAADEGPEVLPAQGHLGRPPQLIRDDPRVVVEVPVVEVH